MLFIRKLLLKNIELFKFTSLISSPSSRIFNRNGSSYEGTGKTTAKIMNDDAEYGLMINSYSSIGFRLNNNMTVIGPMAIFPKTVLSWNINGINDVNEDSLLLFSKLEPKLDILVFGTGDQTNDTRLYMNVINFMRKHNISIEILPTDQAIPTFNFLNSEDRCVAGAFIPPSKVKTAEDDVLATKLRYKNLYEVD